MTALNMKELVGGFLETEQNHVKPTIKDLFAAQQWVDQNVHDCQEDCNEKAQIRVQLEGVRCPVLVACPILTKQCMRGKRYMSCLKDEAASFVPSEVPKLFRKNISNPDQTLALCGVSGWNAKGIMYIYGDTGTGKSFAAAWFIYDYILGRLQDRWDEPWTWREIASYKLRWMTAFSICLERGNLYEAESAPMLVVDDLGCEVGSSSNKAILNELIAQRYNSERPTIITSSFDLNQLESHYQDRMYERIIQTGRIIYAGKENRRIAA